MKIALRAVCIIAIIAIMAAPTAMAAQAESSTIVIPEDEGSSVPVVCGSADAVTPIIVAANSSPCPGKVYCNNPNTTCGEYCCEWGYFYSNACDCKCYRSSYDAGAKCSNYFRCN